MKKVSKAILVSLGVLAALVIVAVAAVNLYIQSPGVQLRIQDEFGRALKLPLKITNTNITPWSGLRISGITIPDGDADLLEATSFNARYRILPLLGGKLVIYSMSVENPKVIWAQNEKGKWELPKEEMAPAESKETPTGTPSGILAPQAGTPAEAPAATPAPAAEPDTGEPKVSRKRSGLRVVIEGFEINNGTVTLLDHERNPVAEFTGVHLVYTTMTAEKSEGRADIAHAVWQNAVALDQVSTPFVYEQGDLSLPDITGTFGGGPIRASFDLKQREPKSPFTLKLKFDNADLNQLAKDNDWAAGEMAGNVSGTLDLQGSAKAAMRAEGFSSLTLKNGRFHEISYLEMIGQALQIRELSDLRLTESNAQIRIADEKAFVEALALNSSDLQLTAMGYARFDGKLQLNAQLNAPETLVKKLPSIVSDNFVAGKGTDRYIDFLITGKVNKPKTDLLDKIVGKKIEAQFDDFVSSIFGGKRKKEDAPKKEEKKKKVKASEATPAPAGHTIAPMAATPPAVPPEPAATPTTAPASPSDAPAPEGVEEQ